MEWDDYLRRQAATYRQLAARLAAARVALASIAVSASFNLSGCAAIEELKETFL
jgi:hypothetical protein